MLFIGLFTNFHSFISLFYKRFLISCLLHRILNLCSTYVNFHVQLEIVRKLFNLNGFPSHMFDHLVRRFLNNSELKIEDADVKDDVKMAWHIHTWAYHAIFTSSLMFASSILSSLISSNLNPSFTQFLKKMFISAFHSLAHSLFKFALKSPDFAMLLIPTLTFDLFFTHPHASLPSFLLRIATLSF